MDFAHIYRQQQQQEAKQEAPTGAEPASEKATPSVVIPQTQNKWANFTPASEKAEEVH